MLHLLISNLWILCMIFTPAMLLSSPSLLSPASSLLLSQPMLFTYECWHTVLSYIPLLTSMDNIVSKDSLVYHPPFSPSSILWFTSFFVAPTANMSTDKYLNTFTSFVLPPCNMISTLSLSKFFVTLVGIVTDFLHLPSVFTVSCLGQLLL